MKIVGRPDRIVAQNSYKRAYINTEEGYLATRIVAKTVDQKCKLLISKCEVLNCVIFNFFNVCIGGPATPLGGPLDVEYCRWSHQIITKV